MSETAEIVEIKRLRPVKWSAIEKKVQPYRDGYIKVFLEYEGRPLIDEDGEPIRNGHGNQIDVTAATFAARNGIPKTTFNRWLFNHRGYSPSHLGHVTTGESYGSVQIHSGSGENVSAPRAVGSGATSSAPKGANGGVGADTFPEHHGQCSHCPDFVGRR